MCAHQALPSAVKSGDCASAPETAAATESDAMTSVRFMMSAILRRLGIAVTSRRESAAPSVRRSGGACRPSERPEDVGRPLDGADAEADVHQARAVQFLAEAAAGICGHEHPEVPAERIA